MCFFSPVPGDAIPDEEIEESMVVFSRLIRLAENG
jgi:hypothetical protein